MFVALSPLLPVVNLFRFPHKNHWNWASLHTPDIDLCIPLGVKKSRELISPVSEQRNRITRHCLLETMDSSERPTKKLIPNGQKRNGQERRGGRACDINYGKVEKRVQRTKDDRPVVAQSPLLTPTLKTHWFNCPILDDSEFGQVQCEMLWNLSARCDCFLYMPSGAAANLTVLLWWRHSIVFCNLTAFNWINLRVRRY